MRGGGGGGELLTNRLYIHQWNPVYQPLKDLDRFASASNGEYSMPASCEGNRRPIRYISTNATPDEKK
jgi:hypothetical protein